MSETFECIVSTCHEPPVVVKPILLCELHSLEIVSAIVPGILSRSVKEARVITSAEFSLTKNAAVYTLPSALPAKHSSLVYIIKNGTKAKIGHTTNLNGRLSALTLRKSSVLVALVGSAKLERALHSRFNAHRDGDTEWFAFERPIRDYVLDRQMSGIHVQLGSSQSVKEKGGVMSAEATRILIDRLKDLRDNGHNQIEYAHLRDIPAIVGRSRPWVYSQLQRLTNQGKLSRNGSIYEIKKGLT